MEVSRVVVTVVGVGVESAAANFSFGVPVVDLTCSKCLAFSFDSGDFSYFTSS